LSGKIDFYENHSEILTDKVFEVGEIYFIKDGLLAMPESDRKAQRKIHKGRPVVVVQNNSGNSNPINPIITVAPISSVTKYKKPNDIPLTPKEDNVNKDSLLLLSLIQPILKVDLERCIGSISDEKLKQALYIIGGRFGIID